MSYVIYNLKTTAIHLGKNMNYSWSTGGPGRYATESAAKAGLTRFVKKGELVRSEWAIAEYGYYTRKIEKMETKRNLLSGKKFRQSVNTPLCCDPSSETYWSM